jgi:hypothetical protein
MPQPIFVSLLPLLRSREEGGLSAFSTPLTKKHGKGDFSQAIPLFHCHVFAVIMKRKWNVYFIPMFY